LFVFFLDSLKVGQRHRRRYRVEKQKPFQEKLEATQKTVAEKLRDAFPGSFPTRPTRLLCYR
jgi:hypothetical protein